MNSRPPQINRAASYNGGFLAADAHEDCLRLSSWMSSQRRPSTTEPIIEDCTVFDIVDTYVVPPPALVLPPAPPQQPRRIDGTHTFEQVLRETTAPSSKLPAFLECTPLSVALGHDHLTMLAAACRFAAQHTQAARPDLNALADSLLMLHLLPDRQKPPNSYQCELRWVPGAETFVLSPQLLRDNGTEGPAR